MNYKNNQNPVRSAAGLRPQTTNYGNHISRTTCEPGYNRIMPIDFNYIYPIYIEEVMANAHYNIQIEIFGRIQTMMVPIMDNIFINTAVFYAPYSTLWSNFYKMLGWQENPGDSINYTIPQATCGSTGIDYHTLWDYIGVPPKKANGTFSRMPGEMYYQIYNWYFRDQDLQISLPIDKGDTNKAATSYVLQKCNKSPDFINIARPNITKFQNVTIGIGSTAPIINTNSNVNIVSTGDQIIRMKHTNDQTERQLVSQDNTKIYQQGNNTSGGLQWTSNTNLRLDPSNLYADLSAATAITMQDLNKAQALQKLLERDSLYGTTPQQIINAHWDGRLESDELRIPVYIGGSDDYARFSVVEQTSNTNDPQEPPLGSLGSNGVINASTNNISYYTKEPGLIMGLAYVRSFETYEHSLPRFLQTKTRYDLSYPEFEGVGPEAILYKDVYYTGDNTLDTQIWGYTKRNFYRFQRLNDVVGMMRSSHPQTLNCYHLATNMTTRPNLNSDFLKSNTPKRSIVIQDIPPIILNVRNNVRATLPLADSPLSSPLRL